MWVEFPQKNIEGETKRLSTPQIIRSPAFDSWVDGDEPERK